MKERSSLKALKEGNMVYHTIRTYEKPIGENGIEILPTAYCNEILPDNTMDKRPILPINSDAIVLFKDGKKLHYGRKVWMRIVDASHDNYYLAYYYVNEDITDDASKKNYRITTGYLEALLKHANDSLDANNMVEFSYDVSSFMGAVKKVLQDNGLLEVS